jgi:hypothetical protein
LVGTLSVELYVAEGMGEAELRDMLSATAEEAQRQAE